MLKPLTDITATPLRGGCKTDIHKSLLPFGSFSMCQNVRGKYPGFRKRPGCIALHTTADSTNEVMSMYQFRKRRIDEKHFLAQMSDGDVLNSYATPPDVPELMTLDVAPSTAWSVGDTITGNTSGETCVVTACITTTTYAVKDRSGTFTLGEVLTNGTYTADQGAANPTFGDLAFGSQVYSGTGTGEVPASYSSINDIMLYSNGVDQHQTYTGTANYVNAVIVFDGVDAAPANVPEKGVDYTVKATDGLTSTTVVLSALEKYATPGFQCVFICTPVPASSLTFTVLAANDIASVSSLWYRKNTDAWTELTSGTHTWADGTNVAGDTLKQTGSMTWVASAVVSEIPMYMYGRTGYWYQLRVTETLTNPTTLTKITFGSGFQDLVNVWDGYLPYAIEAMHYDDSASLYKTYATGSVSIRLMEKESGAPAGDDDKDKLYFSSFDPIMGVYIDVGATPNTATSAVVYGVKAWTGSAFTTVGTITDGTNGLTNSGWITWPRLATVEPSQFKTTQYYAYWYYFWIGTVDLSTSVSIAMFTMPYFDIEKLGKGLCNVAWKDSAAYSFTNYSNYIYIAAPNNPTALNGDNYGILKAGDGRTNKVVAMRKFYNELIAFQEEKGVEGGSVTMFQGYSPSTWGKLVLSSSIGTFSNKTVDVVEGVLTATETTEQVKTLCFFLSRYGVCATDGLAISIISDDIQNYFDPTDTTTSIRRGYEDKMWLKYDSAFNVIRIGLVCGTSATLPNIFPVFDLTDKQWYFDVLAQGLSCMAEIEAGSGNITALQVGGGTNDGLVYLLNSGTNDISEAIDSYITQELNLNGKYIQLDMVLVRAEAVAASAGDITATFTANTIAAGTKTLSMSPEVATQTIRRHLFPINITNQNISVKWQNNAASRAMLLLDTGFKTQVYDDR